MKYEIKKFNKGQFGNHDDGYFYCVRGHQCADERDSEYLHTDGKWYYYAGIYGAFESEADIETLLDKTQKVKKIEDIIQDLKEYYNRPYHEISVTGRQSYEMTVGEVVQS